MSLTLLFHADATGPVCNRLAKAGKGLEVASDKRPLDLSRKTVLRWGSVVAVNAATQINPVEAVKLARDKRASRTVLGDLAPATWFTLRDVKTPCVIRPKKHHAGIEFHVCKTDEEVKRVITRLTRRGKTWYASELIDKAEEYRVFVLHGRVVCMSQRFPANATDVAWNLALGGRLINAKRDAWRPDVCKAAIVACERLGLDWGAIDLAVAKNGKVYVFEANTAPGLRNPYTLGQIAKSLMWAASNGKAPEIKTGAAKWSHFIHPGLKEKG